MWSDKNREACLLMFNGVGLNYTTVQAEAVLQILSLFECRDTIIEGSLDSQQKKLFTELKEHTHQFLIFTAFCQSTFLRPDKLELTQLQDPPGLDLAKLKQLAKNLGMIDEVKPQHKEYPRVIIQGAFQFRIETRLRFFVRLMQNKEIIGVKHLLLSVGERALHDHESTKKEGAKTEIDMARLVAKKFAAEYPEVFKGITIDFNNAQKKPDANRADSDDAAAETAKMYEQEEPVLVLTDQPFCQYHSEAYRIFFHPTPVEGIGEAASEDYNGWNFCNSFSRLMYSIARRHLILDCGMEAAEANKVINAYKKQYQCDSSLYFEGEVRPECIISVSNESVLSQQLN